VVVETGQFLNAKSSLYQVKPGDNLYSIAFVYQVSAQAIIQQNPGLSTSGSLRVGQSIKVPNAFSSKVSSVPHVSNERQESSENHLQVHWIKPVDGVVVKRGAHYDGILIYTHINQKVMASLGGRVVYVGSGIRGYGNLILIQQDDGLVTAYGFNQSVRVKSGDVVKKGQVISTVGLSQDGKPCLYFEVRSRQGQPLKNMLTLWKKMV
jgi:murein DD-endopeptidase MepM/ murein hydrolase activator NlpD